MSEQYVDVSKYKDHWFVKQSGSQEKTIQNILRNEWYNGTDAKLYADSLPLAERKAPKLFVPDLKLLGFKNPDRAIKSLESRGVIRISHGLPSAPGDEIELVTDIVYCDSCRTELVFVWDMKDHLRQRHVWDERVFKANPYQTRFHKKPLPNKGNHDYEQIGELEDNKLNVKCRICGDERPIWIEHVNHECDPSYKGVYIHNPQDTENFEVRKGSDDKYQIIKTKAELDAFIQQTIEEVNA